MDLGLSIIPRNVLVLRQSSMERFFLGVGILMNLVVGINFSDTCKVSWNYINLCNLRCDLQRLVNVHASFIEFYGIPWISMELWHTDIDIYHNIS